MCVCACAVCECVCVCVLVAFRKSSIEFMGQQYYVASVAWILACVSVCVHVCEAHFLLLQYECRRLCVCFSNDCVI